MGREVGWFWNEESEGDLEEEEEEEASSKEIEDEKIPIDLDAPIDISEVTPEPFIAEISRKSKQVSEIYCGPGSMIMGETHTCFSMNALWNCTLMMIFNQLDTLIYMDKYREEANELEKVIYPEGSYLLYFLLWTFFKVLFDKETKNSRLRTICD